jgi:hypothetical protein
VVGSKSEQATNKGTQLQFILHLAIELAGVGSQNPGRPD